MCVDSSVPGVQSSACVLQLFFFPFNIGHVFADIAVIQGFLSRGRFVEYASGHLIPEFSYCFETFLRQISATRLCREDWTNRNQDSFIFECFPRRK